MERFVPHTRADLEAGAVGRGRIVTVEEPAQFAHWSVLPTRAEGDINEGVYTVGKWLICQDRTGAWYRVEA